MSSRNPSGVESRPQTGRRSLSPFALVFVWMVGVMLLLAGCSSNVPTEEEEEPTSESASGNAGEEGEPGLEATPPTVETVVCQVYTPEPGFLVLVDGVEAKTAEGKPLLTPCEISVPLGEHMVMVVREKWEDTGESALISSPRSFEFKPEFAPFAVPKGYFASPYTRAVVGVPISLTNLNTEGKVYDPFIADEGKTLYFAGERQQGKGIYFSHRESVWDEFPVPEFIVSTKEIERVCSPSVTSDGSLLAYGIVKRARIRGVEKLGEQFGNKSDLLFAKGEDEVWPSMQISGNGLAIYCVHDVTEEERSVRVVSRRSTEEKFTGGGSAKYLPWVHPALSSDLLRQYMFDGKKLRRVTRRSLSEEWSKSKTIAKFEKSNCQRDQEYRQFCVSHDEQWVYYTDDPAKGNLYVVRVSDGPGWGFQPRGQSIPQKDLTVAEAEPEVKPEMPEEGAAEPVAAPSANPQALPLPYVALQSKLDALLKIWDFDGADKLLKEAMKNPDHAADQEVLGWDQEEIGLCREFADKVVAALGQLKEGDEIRIGLGKVKIVKFANGVLEFQSGSTAVSKKPFEIQPLDLVPLADKHADKASAEYQFQMAVFLARVGAARDLVLAPRLAKAGPAGKTFELRRMQRKQHLVKQEIKRDNIPAAMKLIAEFEKSSRPETKVEAEKLYGLMYAHIVWEPVSDRKWDTPAPGEFIATLPAKKTPESFLLSDREFENFELSLEWKATGISQGGVFFRYGRGNEIDKSPKVHLANDANARPDPFCSGALFGKQPPKLVNVKPEGMWNTLVMRVQGKLIKVKINGADVLEAPLTGPDTRGFICLDGEFTGVSYRKVLVYELPK